MSETDQELWLVIFGFALLLYYFILGTKCTCMLKIYVFLPSLVILYSQASERFGTLNRNDLSLDLFPRKLLQKNAVHLQLDTY